MARNAGGTYSLPGTVNPVVSHTLGTANWANTTLQDLATEMTDSLDRSGKGGMLAPLGLVNGTVAAPALTFNSETSSGWYRAGAGDLRLSVAGVDQLKLDNVAAPAFSHVSQLAAANGGVDAVFNSANVRTAGFLFDIQNQGADRLTVGFDGTLYLSNRAAVIAAGGTNLSLSLLGQKAVADTGVDVIIGSQATRTAGNLLDVQNNGSSRFYVDAFGDLNLAAGGGNANPYIISAAANAGLRLFGNKNAADAGTDVIITSNTTRTSGGLLDVQNNGVSVFKVDTTSPTGAILMYGTLPRLVAGPTNTGLSYFGRKDAADPGTDHVFTTVNTRTAGLLLDVQNNGNSRFQVTANGTVILPNGSTPILASAANSGVSLLGNKSAADTGTDVILGSQATRTAGNLLDVQNNGVSKGSLDFAGNLTVAGTVTSGGTTGWTRVESSSDQIVNSLSATDLTGLSFAAAASKIYRIHGKLYVANGASLQTIQNCFKSASAPTRTGVDDFVVRGLGGLGSGTNTVNSAGDAFFGTPLTSFASLAANGGCIIEFDAYVPTSTTPGTIQLQGNSLAGPNQFTVQKGSYIEYVAL